MKDYRSYILLITLGAVFYLPFIGNVHLFDWDEVNFAEISREMIVTGDFLKVQVNFVPFYEKPPLFFWMQVIAMKAFGVNEFAARFPNAIIGIITLIALFRIGARLFGSRFGMLWTLAYFGSILPHLYSKSGIIDPLFNLFIFLGIYHLMKFKWSKENSQLPGFTHAPFLYLFLSGIFIGLALLTKGPVAYLIMILTFAAYWAWNRFKFFIRISDFLIFSLVAFGLMFIWLGLETYHHGYAFMKEFIVYQIRLFTTHDAGHVGFPGFHIIVLLFGCFPASVFAIRGFYKLRPESDYQQDFRKWMVILFWVVLVLFSVVQSKIVHYSSLAYFPLTFLAALVISNIIAGKINLTRGMRFGLATIAVVFILLSAFAPVVGKNPEWIKPLFSNNTDALASLHADVSWSLWESISGLILIATLVLFFFLIHRQKIMAAFQTLFIGIAVVVISGLIFYAGRIEIYSQNANAEFCKSLAGKDCYIKTSGFKSYIPLFYSKRMPPIHAKSDDIGWLTWENVDKDVYIIAKSHLKSYWESVPTTEIIGERNGFLFVKRKK
ncbi:MAG: glycosyltransferase family 39 protein [Bacteroidetes bacterium]|nr:glycosyltransferase family 39 protein [Bacteroidota bacterium]